MSQTRRLLYPSAGIVERTDEIATPRLIEVAYLVDGNTVELVFPDKSKESLLVKEGSIEPYILGFTIFQTQDGGEYVVRPVDDLDGAWASKFKVALPPQAIPTLLRPNKETETPMPYLENEDEALIALKSPETSSLVGVMYLNRTGAYTRLNGIWTAISPNHTAFDGMTPYNVKPETAQEFIDAFDNGASEFADVETFLDPVK